MNQYCNFESVTKGPCYLQSGHEGEHLFLRNEPLLHPGTAIDHVLEDQTSETEVQA
jgi:hypothetical protein